MSLLMSLHIFHIEPLFAAVGRAAAVSRLTSLAGDFVRDSTQRTFQPDGYPTRRAAPSLIRSVIRVVSVAVLAGSVSTVLFTASTLPMLIKAARTKELSSYSRGNLVLANLGNAVHSIYVLQLPPGPIWALHSFYVITSGLMLFWHLRYAKRPQRQQQPSRPQQMIPTKAAPTPLRGSLERAAATTLLSFEVALPDQRSTGRQP